MDVNIKGGIMKRKNNNKLAALILSLLLTITLVSCDATSKNNDSKNDANVEDTNANQDATDEVATDEEVTNEEATDEEATNEEATNEEATNEEATNEEATNEEATNEEATDEEATDEEASVDPGAQRNAIPDEYKWDLEKLYSDTDTFLSEIALVEESIVTLASYGDTFTDSFGNFKKTLDLYQSSERKLNTLFVFATMQSHTNTENTDFADLVEYASQLSTDFRWFDSALGHHIRLAPSKSLSRSGGSTPFTRTK
jgi:flagellar biosynthesis GTPase FlhF